MDVNQAELSRIAEVHRSTVSKWIRDGLPIHDKKINTNEFLSWYLDYKTGSDPIKARTRKESAQAEKLELEIAEKKGELVRYSDVQMIYCGYVTTVKAKLFSMPHKLASIALACETLPEVEEKIRAELFEVCDEFHKGVHSQLLMDVMEEALEIVQSRNVTIPNQSTFR